MDSHSSIIASILIIVWNRSLVSLAFFQIIRNTVPLFTVLIYRIWFSRSYATATYLSLIPIVAGAGMCTAGDYHYTVIGLAVTIGGVILAAVKVYPLIPKILVYTLQD